MNVEICRSCQSKWHLFGECTRKRRCLWCARGFQKCFEVEKETCKKGQLFNTCSNICGFFDWVKKWKSNEESSTVNQAMNVAANEKAEDLPSMLESLPRITEKRDNKVSLNVTFHKGKGSSEGSGKGIRSA